MQRIFSFVLVLFLVIPVAAHADSDDGTLLLEGNWTNQSYDGIFTQLEIQANGRFVFREMYSEDLRRSYMCGNLADAGNALSLTIKQFKERSSTGAIVQAVGTTLGRFAVQSRTDNQLVLKIDSRVVVLERA